MRLVYLSPVPWSSFAQRPHKFVEWFQAKYGSQVLWVDPYPTRLPKISDFLCEKSVVGAGNQLSFKEPPWLHVVLPRALPIEPLPGSGSINRFFWKDVLASIDQFLAESDCLVGIGKPSALALQVLSSHPEVQSFYDAMDDFPAFYQGLSRWGMARRERAVSARVGKIMVSSTTLAGRFGNQRHKVLMALNACATEVLPCARATPYRSQQPVLGYVGTIGHWFDWPLVIALASANPRMRIRLVGPIYCLPPAGLPQNIEFLPACCHAEALVAMQGFSVGLIPFKLNELTASVDPIKYYEYHALGLPVVSTRFGEMALRERQSGIFLVANQSDLVSVVADALAYESDRNEIRQFCTENSWEARFDAIDIFR